MNILYIAYSCNPYAGSEDKIGWWVPYESARTNQVYVITKEEQREPIEKYLSEYPQENMKFYYVDIPNVYKRVFTGFMYSGRLNIWNKRVFPVARKICGQKKIDIIHQITPIEFRAIGDYGKIEGAKFVCGPLGGGEFLPKGLVSYAKGHTNVEIIRSAINYLHRFTLKMTGKLNLCDYVMFANHETQDFVSGLSITCPYELVFDNGLRLDELSDVSNKENCIFLAASRMIYRKGYDFLLDALKGIPESMKYQVRIVGDGPELSNLQKKCKENSNLSKHVIFTGAIPYDEIEKEYSKASAFIMPSIRETTGTVLLEAMSKGVPVITINKFGGATVYDEETGWLYGGDSKESFIENLRNTIIYCINNPDEMVKRGKRAREKAKYYTWQEKNKQYQEIYQKLLNV